MTTCTRFFHIAYSIQQHIQTIEKFQFHGIGLGKGAPYWLSPLFCLGTPSCHHLIGFGSVLHRWSEEVKPPYHWQHGSLKGWAGVFHVKVDGDPTSKSLTQQSIPMFHTPVVLPPHSSSVSSHGGHPVCYLLASMGWHPSLHQAHMILLAILSVKMSTPTTHHLESLPIFSGCSGWCPWEKP